MIDYESIEGHVCVVCEHIANGRFDLALTGEIVIAEHDRACATSMTAQTMTPSPVDLFRIGMMIVPVRRYEVLNVPISIDVF
jgi:hypothetical protein